MMSSSINTIPLDNLSLFIVFLFLTFVCNYFIVFIYHFLIFLPRLVYFTFLFLVNMLKLSGELYALHIIQFCLGFSHLHHEF